MVNEYIRCSNLLTNNHVLLDTINNDFKRDQYFYVFKYTFMHGTILTWRQPKSNLFWHTRKCKKSKEK
jgi:hypothetical protein